MLANRHHRLSVAGVAVKFSIGSLGYSLAGGRRSYHRIQYVCRRIMSGTNISRVNKRQRYLWQLYNSGWHVSLAFQCGGVAMAYVASAYGSAAPLCL